MKNNQAPVELFHGNTDQVIPYHVYDAVRNHYQESIPISPAIFTVQHPTKNTQVLYATGYVAYPNGKATGYKVLAYPIDPDEIFRNDIRIKDLEQFYSIPCNLQVWIKS